MDIEPEHCNGLEKPEKKSIDWDNNFESKVGWGEKCRRSTSSSVQIASNYEQKEKEELDLYWTIVNERDGEHNDGGSNSVGLGDHSGVTVHVDLITRV